MAFEGDVPVQARVRQELDLLIREFAGSYTRETVASLMDEAVAGFRGRRDEDMPVFAARFVRDRLLQRGQGDGTIAKDVPEVLFVCVHNAGRSQMAAVICAALGGNEVHVRSAGSEPANEINPAVRTVIDEMGLDLSQEFPKPLTDDAVRAADVVITMGCGDVCPVYPGKRYLDWELDDPADQPIEVVRRIRDDIRVRVSGLLTELGVHDVPVAR